MRFIHTQCSKSQFACCLLQFVLTIFHKEKNQNNVDRDLDRDLSRSIENAAKLLCRETLGIFGNVTYNMY